MQTYTEKAAALQVSDLDWSEKNYQAVIRTFKNGHIEVCTSVVKAMQKWQRADQWAEAAPARPDGLTDAQNSRIDAEAEQYKAWKRAQKEAKMDQLTDEEKSFYEERDKGANIARAVRRARQRIRFHCHQLCVDHLVTLTYRENMESVERLQADWQEFVRLVRKQKPHWKFVACRERQDRGALHLHIAVRGRQDIGLLRSSWYKALGGNGHETGDSTPGQVDVRGPSKRFGSRTQDWKVQKLSGYMTKYMSKAFEELDSKGTKRYWQSKGIEPPEVQKVWLGSASFVEAIIDSHTLFRSFVGRTETLWASEGYECIWLAG